MTFAVGGKMDWLCQRCHRESVSQSFFRPGFLICFMGMLLTLVMYPALKTLGIQLHSALTGSYVSGHHSVVLINCPNEQAAKDIGRAIMERRLAACVNIFPKSVTLYFWKGEIQDATEILLLVKTRTSKVQKLTDFVKSLHPYDVPEVLSFPVEDGSLPYMKWMDDAVPDD
ncbi:protein CutA homolog [Megalops cyprinoides]|uniref:protein CutA homolog n=1 Tax=Megalops cyprinoides TaxID=118141 RepID=UPI001864AEA5|nr:protein CutA homolog [Megalops cyprinoides]